MKKIILAVFLIILPFKSYASTAGEIAEGAQQEYESGLYAKAIDSWQKLWDMGFHNGNILYNQGNAYWRMGEVGEAEWKWLQAELLMPRDASLHSNLYLLKTKLEKKSSDGEGVRFLLRKIPWYRVKLNEFQSLIGMVVLTIVFSTLAMRRVLNQRSWYSGYASLLFIPILFCFLQWSMHLDRRYFHVLGVSLTSNALLRERPTAESSSLETIPEGKQLRILRKEGDFLLVKSDSGKEGWMQTKEIGEVR